MGYGPMERGNRSLRWYAPARPKGTGLRDSSRGMGLQPTWPADIPLLWIPIDHCLYSDGIEIRGRRTGPDVGSDHFPLIVDFELVE